MEEYALWFECKEELVIVGYVVEDGVVTSITFEHGETLP